MHSTNKVRWAAALIASLLLCTGVFADESDDYVPEVTDRVARISFLRGDVQIRRADSQDWERAVLNLPVVEGDELVTDGTGRFEIQFNSYTHLRADGATQIKIVALKDEGIAIGVPLGTISVRATEFDPARAYFEIDAPKTTVSIQRAGSYRIDTGTSDSTEVFVSANDGGEARVYSSDAGFTLRTGRRARVYIAGSRLGEWETSDVSVFTDDFAEWTIERDEMIARRLRDAYYDRYYDRDIYGAEDLNDYGDWVYTRPYGYVWRPYSRSVSSYADWSPYRYGHWRWIPPYGWTWVNDEPWGWATYHHGRWVWYNGSWYWTPYGYYRYRRSWWQPALVVVSIYGGNVCWYPLPYSYSYYDYNSYYYSHYPRRGRHRGNHNSGTGGPPPHGGGPTGGGPVPSPTPGGPVDNSTGRFKVNRPPLEEVPPRSVISVALSEFGRGRRGFNTAPPDISTKVLSKIPSEQQSPPILPTYVDLGGKISQEIRSQRPPMVRTNAEAPIGAATRKTDTPLDQELQKSRIFGNRPPLQINTSQGDVNPPPSGVEPSAPRRTGAVERPVVKRDEPADTGNTPIRTAPEPKTDRRIYSTPTTKPDEPVRVPRNDEPVRPSKIREDRSPRFETPPRNDPPPRSNPPPRNDPPPRSDPPPRNDPPPKSDPPPPKNDPPPTKSEPADRPVDRKKDGRK